MIPVVIASSITLLLGTIYPAYASYKALRTKTVTNQYKWMTYWIVLAAFSCIEGILDLLIGFWLPFYLELKLLFRIWLILPISQRSLGSGIIYQRWVHRYLMAREGDIDRSIARFQDQSYNSLVQAGTSTFHWLKNGILHLAVVAPAYAAEFMKKHGYVEAEVRGAQEVPFTGIFQRIMENLGTQFQYDENKYDNERFEEINSKSETDNNQNVQHMEPVPSENTDGNKNSDLNQTLPRPPNTKNVSKGRKQPKRKVTAVKVSASDEFSSDDMELDPSFDPTNCVTEDSISILNKQKTNQKS